jgi:chaperonin GroES
MKFRPLHDRVVVKRLEEELKTKGGIIIPDMAAEKPQTGQVVAAGPGARGEDGKLQPIGVKSGDKVLFGKWSGTGTPDHEGVRHHGHPRLTNNSS